MSIPHKNSKLWVLNSALSRCLYDYAWKIEQCLEKNLSLEFPTRSDTNQVLQKMARGLKFWSKEVEGLYYLCSDNKSADQLHGNRAADLHLCFRIILKNADFLMTRLK